MPSLQDADPVVAIATADWHLSHKPPIARSVEDDWYGVMSRNISRVRKLSKKYNVPVIIAGDIFDKPTNPPELINFVLRKINFQCFAIPGQHDLENHSYGNIQKTSYWTLVEAGKINNIEPPSSLDPPTSYGLEEGQSVYLHGVPWGFDITPRDKDDDKLNTNIAVVHKYIWCGKNKYKGAPEENNIEALIVGLKGYNTAIFGDNHKGFLYDSDLCVFNCGTLMRRKVDEINYHPGVGLVRASGKITVSYFELDEDEDKFLEVEVIEDLAESAMDIAEIVRMISEGQLAKKFIDFREAVKRFCEKNKVTQKIQALLSEMME